MRSWLFVPADSERKLARAREAGADALILDLEDSVAPEAKAAARATALAFLEDTAGGGGPRRYVRLNPLASGLADDDIAGTIAGRPDGYMLPKSLSGADVAHLDAKITAREALGALPEGGVAIAAIATESAAALFGLGSYAGASPRLAALTWGAEDLSADLGARTSRDASGRLTPPYALARSLCLAGAVAAGAQPVDTVFVAFRDQAGLAAECAAAARDGFTGKLAIHPGQVSAINAAFTPSDVEVARAQRIVDAFAATPGAGVVAIDGEMVDMPHLKRAERLLARARLAGS